jgi:hypothetical protein
MCVQVMAGRVPFPAVFDAKIEFAYFLSLLCTVKIKFVKKINDNNLLFV